MFHLVCVGGDQTYMAGAYKGTPLETTLPVNMELDSKKVLPPGAVAEKIASGFGHSEGPAWHPDGYLIFCNPPRPRPPGPIQALPKSYFSY